ncbi:MAG: hypothetical protein MI741_00295, partial [Rhodospirillales bacterium]|nr:hypothetical protein [Rhodospirillales bacterium]
MAGNFEQYLRQLCSTPLDEHTEHTGRSALEALLNEFVATSAHRGATVQHEPKRVAAKGAPDFKITYRGMVLGYVETKPIGENLDMVLKSEQIARYKSLSQNILLTDYLHFIWIGKDGVRRETLCHATDLEDHRFKPREDKAIAVAALLEAFLSTAPEGIGRAQQLALALAIRSKLLRDYLGEQRDWTRLRMKPTFGHAVFLPDLDDTVALKGPNRFPEIIGGRSDLAKFDSWIDG